MPIEMMIRKLRLHSLPYENIEALRSIVTPVKKLPEDSVIVREGDLSTQCCVIMSGFAYRSKVSETGKRQILSFHIAGDMPDLEGLPLKRMDHDLTTLSEAQLGFINHEALEGSWPLERPWHEPSGERRLLTPRCSGSGSSTWARDRHLAAWLI
ncbi:Crp/Fnr family transcriptional regulator [Bradyrhizobium brasilense]|uniref:Crp/Fnr family transcriptional regulator n=1 Tax=Bradyrhizobium brasilense TaxID=1419277 RepID=UPI001E5B7388|nr:cyclic nucleotide-binding domain-containing protein [Bradyrhizobium brasilense]